MIATIADAALRSLLLAVLVWAGLRVFRVRNVLAQRSAWAAVLASAILMPFALPISSLWHVFPAETIPIPQSFRQMEPEQRPLAAIDSAAAPEAASELVLGDGRATAQLDTSSREQSPYTKETLWLRVASARERLATLQSATWVKLGAGLYLAIAAGFLIRLVCGLFSILRLWHRSQPAELGDALGQYADLTVRSSCDVLSPVTIGSGILLPGDFEEWDREKLRVVLAHERAHIRHGDFYWQILASLYAALAWFSPLGWWLKCKLSDLGEAISDRAGLAEARNRSAYARILLEFAATPHPNFIGVAMARKSNISSRIERLLNDRVFLQAFSGGRWVRVAFLVVPLALFALTALVRVEAAGSTAPEMVAFINPLDFLPPPAPAVIPPAVHMAAAAAVPVAPAQAATPAASSPTEATFDRTLTITGKLDLKVSTASGNIHLTHGNGSQVQIHGHVHSREASDAAEVSAIAANPPIAQEGNTIRIGKQNEHGTNHISIDYEIVAPADAGVATDTGSGNIADEGVGQGAKLETGSGNITASGLQGGFKAETGSGNIAVENAGEGAADAQTGSGSIDIKGVHGSLKAETGSGGIKAEGTPSAEWKLGSGSGGIELSTGNAAVTLDASTGSGKITTATGVAMGNSSDHHHVHVELNGGGPVVKVETGSGNIHIQ